LPVIINEMIANVRPDQEPVAGDRAPEIASGADQLAQQLRLQQAIDQERQERLNID